MTNNTIKSVFIVSILSVFFVSAAVTAQENEPVNGMDIVPDFQKSPDNTDKDTCLECHKTLGGKSKQAVLDWQKSVHVKEGRKCNICHRGNASAATSKEAKSDEYNFIRKPTKTDIIEFCGRIECHSIAVFQVRKSPHFKTIIETGEPGCTSCHGYHNIQKSCREVMTETVCSKCHSAEYSSEVISMIFEMEDSFFRIQDDLQYLIDHNADVWELSSAQDENKRLFEQMVHVFSRDEMENTQRIIRLQTGTITQDIQKEKAKVRRLELLYNLTLINIVVIFCGFAAYATVLYFRRRTKGDSQAV